MNQYPYLMHSCAYIYVCIQYLTRKLVLTISYLFLKKKIQKVGRSLFCLGMLIRYGNSLLSNSDQAIDVASSLSLFKKYLLMEDFFLKARSLQV